MILSEPVASRRRAAAWMVLFFALAILGGCGDDQADRAPDPWLQQLSESGEQDRLSISERRTGDLEDMLERRQIRALVPYSRAFYFVDEQGSQRGLSYEFMQAFEGYINRQLESTLLNEVAIVMVPVTRDRLIPWLLDGRGDVIVADLTVTAERDEVVDFTEPLVRNVRELLISGPSADPIERIEDLADRQVLVRRQSSYFESLSRINAMLAAQGLEPARLEIAPGHFEVGDVLELVNAGVVDHAVADDYLARFWSSVLPDIVVHEDIELRIGADVAFAVRPESVELRKQLDGFLATHRAGTLFGNIQFQRYLEDTRWVTDPTRAGEMERFRQLAQLFQRYAEQYSLDWLLLTAQGYQESRLDHSVESPVGAVGVMQVLPTTGAEMGVGDVTELENNIHAAAKYVRFMIDRYYTDPDISAEDRVLLALASYNAGPRRVRNLRDEAAREGLDPNQWFDHVEVIAARQIGRETVDYVRNIYKYYVAYRMVEQRSRQLDQGTG